MKCILLFIILAINVIDAKSALKKSMLKVMNHRLEKLSRLLDANQSQLIRQYIRQIEKISQFNVKIHVHPQSK